MLKRHKNKQNKQKGQLSSFKYVVIAKGDSEYPYRMRNRRANHFILKIYSKLIYLKGETG